MEAVERERSEIRVEERKKNETVVEERKTKKKEHEKAKEEKATRAEARKAYLAREAEIWADCDREPSDTELEERWTTFRDWVEPCLGRGRLLRHSLHQLPAWQKHSQLHLQPKREQQQDTTNPPGSSRIRSPSRRASPSRVVVVTSDPSYIEAKLKVKGATESEDKDLSLLATVFRSGFMIRRFTSKLSTLEMNFHEIVRSVEAAITIKVIEGS
ncbi:hypothetical protein QYE76_024798 [Lolium multiflorum]|uniref:DUF6598 domain-containing protein n=1 Tax=Lolium multiflorum TaxID=4521 RepID=A0AAD8VVD0_LOLMU|nr:hypothetical protein QYE76_024798 [Lolium multiflorum]